MSTLILLRHGQSLWNQQNLFTGWVDVDLSPEGEKEATQAGKLLSQAELLADVVHTSVLTRAIRTAELALYTCGRSWIDVRRSWRLNERHYGALQGLDKSETRKRHGDDQLQAWRRGYDTPPPPIESGSLWDVSGDPRYASVPPSDLPTHESLKDVAARMAPYWLDALEPDLRAHNVVLVAAHGNSLRALVKQLESISDDEIAGVEIATGVPRVYELNDDLSAASMSELGDAAAIAAARAAVAAQAHR